MKVSLIAVGKRMPAWVQTGFDEYAKRLPPHCSLELVEIDAGHRGKSTPANGAVREEAERIVSRVPKDALLIALDIKGRHWTTEELAERLSGWLHDGRDLALLVGGPDGLADSLLERCSLRWSLSKLTFPHALVRVMVAEQLYRAWTILTDHPYHRA